MREDALSAPVPIAEAMRCVSDVAEDSDRRFWRPMRWGRRWRRRRRRFNVPRGMLEARDLRVEPFRMDGLEQAIELLVVFLWADGGASVGGMVEGHEAELSRIFQEYLAAATLKSCSALWTIHGGLRAAGYSCGRKFCGRCGDVPILFRRFRRGRRFVMAKEIGAAGDRLSRHDAAFANGRI